MVIKLSYILECKIYPELGIHEGKMEKKIRNSKNHKYIYTAFAAPFLQFVDKHNLLFHKEFMRPNHFVCHVQYFTIYRKGYLLFKIIYVYTY